MNNHVGVRSTIERSHSDVHYLVLAVRRSLTLLAATCLQRAEQTRVHHRLGVLRKKIVLKATRAKKSNVTDRSARSSVDGVIHDIEQLLRGVDVTVGNLLVRVGITAKNQS